MTLEQKAKAYDDALERAKKVLLDKETTNHNVAEFIFPELRESEDERMMREFNDWLCEEIEYRTSDLRDEEDRRTLNMLCYVLTKFKDWLEKQKEPDYLEKFIRLPHLNSDYEVVDDWAYTPSLAHCDSNWGVCWVHCEDGDTLHACIGDTPAEAIDKAVEWLNSRKEE